MRFLVIALSALLIATPALAEEMKALRTITVNGKAERHVVPDEAHLNVNLNSMEPKLAAAKDAHDAKLKKLLSITKRFDIDDKKVRTESSSVQPVYSEVEDPRPNVHRTIRHLDGYRVQTTVDITVADMGKVGDLMQAITDAGFEQGANTEWGDLLSVDYRVSHPEEVQSALLGEAIANAKAKASDMAKAAGAGIGRVWIINEGEVEFPQPRPMPMMSMAKNVAAIAPPAGEQEVNATVTVTYELKD